MKTGVSRVLESTGERIWGNKEFPNKGIGNFGVRVVVCE